MTGGRAIPSRAPAVPDKGSAAGFSALTLGYQGRTLEEVLEIIRAERVQEVLDVRERAASKKPGFSGPELMRTLAVMGVEYVHLASLGCTYAARHALWRSKVTEPFFEEYRRHLETRAEAVQDLVNRVRNSRCLLLCLERDPSRCHRSVLAEKLRAEGISIQDL